MRPESFMLIRACVALLTLWLVYSPSVHAQDTGKGNLVGNRHLTFSPDGRLLAACYGGIDQPGTLRIWEWKSGRLILEHNAPVGVCSASFSPDGDSIAIGVFDKVGKVFDVGSGAVEAEFHGHESHFRTVAYVNSDLVASGSYDTTIRLWNAETGVQIAELGKHTDELRMIVVSPDGRYLLSGSTSPDCRLWNLTTLQETAVFDSPKSICPNVCFSRDGQFFLTARWDGRVRIRETQTQRLRAEVKVGSIRDIDLSPDNSLLLACEDRSVLNAVDLRLGRATADEFEKILAIVQLWNSDDYQVREQASRDLLELGMVALPILDRVASFNVPEFRIRARTVRRKLLENSSRAVDVGHEFNVGVVCFAPDNIHVASGDTGGHVKVWRFRDEMVVQAFGPVE